MNATVMHGAHDVRIEHRSDVLMDGGVTAAYWDGELASK
jgi:hypothetical protein